MFGLGGSDRVHTLAEAVDRLRGEISSAVAEWRRRGLPKVDAARLKRVADAMDRFTTELRATGNKIEQAARTPLASVLGGGAQAELSRLVVSMNGLADEIESVMKEAHG